MDSLPEQLQKRATAHPDRVLLRHRGRDWTYAEAHSAAQGVAASLRELDVQRGDRVAVALPNSAEYVAAYFGIQYCGACAVTLDVAQTERELTYSLNDSGSVAAILAAAPWDRIAGSSDALPTLRAILLAGASPTGNRITARSLDEAMRRPGSAFPAPPRESRAQIIYTSGTTGRPKGVVLSHRNLASNTAAIIESLSLGEGESVFAILPFSYSYGNSLLLTHVSRGGRVVVASDFVFWNDALDLMEGEQVSGFAGVPSSFALLIKRSDFLRRPWRDLRYLTCAGGALPAALVERIRAELPAVALYLMYGQTEAAARLACLPPGDLDRKPGSAGRAIPGVQLSIRDKSGSALPAGETGEIVARGDNVMVGYWNDAEATARVLRDDGLHTGDLGRLDSEGYLFITGRLDDVIKSGGYRIGPQEIEDAVLQVEGVEEVGVTAIADAVLGQVPVVLVVARGADPSLPTRVRKHLMNALPRYKWPRDVHLVAALPRTRNGKLQRRKLAQLVPL